MNRFMKHTLVLVTIAAAFAASVRASSLASDNASDPVYSGGGNYNGLNGGTGFGAWSVTPTVNTGTQGEFIGSSTNNFGSGTSGDIDSAGSKAFGMYDNTNAVSDAIRPFTGGPLTLGQTFMVSLDNGGILTSSSVGIGLQTLGGGTIATNRIEFFFIGGGANYTIQTGSGTNSGVGFTGAGLQLAFTLTGADTMDLLIKNSAGSTLTNWTGLALAGLAGTGIDQFRFFNANAGAGSSADAFVNSLAIVPEPSTIVLVGVGLLGAWFIRRRKT